MIGGFDISMLNYPSTLVPLFISFYFFDTTLFSNWGLINCTAINDLIAHNNTPLLKILDHEMIEICPERSCVDSIVEKFYIPTTYN